VAERLIIVREERFLKTPDGLVWSRWGTGAGTWDPYLREFSKVLVVARVQDVVSAQPGWTRADHPRVTYLRIPYFHGPLEYLAVRNDLIKTLKQYVNSNDPVILRVPSPLANLLTTFILARPYAVEVAGDPYDQMAPGAMRHPLRPLFRRVYVRNQRKLCAHATSINYVTERALQIRYPPAAAADSFAVSDADLPPEAYRPVSKQLSFNPLRVVCVGMMEQLYKGQDLLIRAVALARTQKCSVAATFIGDGAFRGYLESQARQIGVSDLIHFRGVQNRTEIWRELDASDLFALPSRQEGMPRAMLEAMARSLPCIGAAVGGIPELLQPAFLVPPNNPLAIATLLKKLIEIPELLHRASQDNYTKALNYSLENRTKRQISFLQSVSAKCTSFQ
jgi:phosphatidylinositol alpha-1,6-mannosyltransferase